MKDLGLDGSEDNMLAVCFGDGSRILTRGLVINPKTCMGPAINYTTLLYENNLRLALDSCDFYWTRNKMNCMSKQKIHII